MSTFSDAFEVLDDDEDDVELLEVRHKRRSRQRICQSRSKTLSQNNTNEETSAMSTLPLKDEIMMDDIVDLTEQDTVKLPPLRSILPEAYHTFDQALDQALEPEGNIDRPYYDEWDHNEGFVAWWDNRTGKGMIINHRCSLEHKIELKDIKWSNYGALIPGSMVEYEYSDDGIGNGFSKFWVVSGCEYVL